VKEHSILLIWLRGHVWSGKAVLKFKINNQSTILSRAGLELDDTLINKRVIKFGILPGLGEGLWKVVPCGWKAITRISNVNT
jgi:hypothetical protein